MAKTNEHKLSEAITRQRPRARGAQRDRPAPTYESVAEQTREAKENQEARVAEASIRDRMVDIGRGNQQAGR